MRPPATAVVPKLLQIVNGGKINGVDLRDVPGVFIAVVDKNYDMLSEESFLI